LCDDKLHNPFLYLSLEWVQEKVLKGSWCPLDAYNLPDGQDIRYLLPIPLVSLYRCHAAPVCHGGGQR